MNFFAIENARAKTFGAAFIALHCRNQMLIDASNFIIIIILNCKTVFFTIDYVSDFQDLWIVGFVHLYESNYYFTSCNE